MIPPEFDVLKLAGPNELEAYNNLHRVNIDRWRNEQVGAREVTFGAGV